MTTYLTKTEGDKSLHFRVTPEETGVDIVEGQFYHWLSKRFEGCGAAADAEKRAEELVREKQAEGYTIQEFVQTGANTTQVYDKAKWHFGGDFPEDLDDFQGYVHTGMFLGWLIDRDLVSDEFKSNNEKVIAGFKEQKFTGAEIFETCCDGVLMIEELSETGNRFALDYFEFDTGSYLPDYEQLLGQGLPSTYHVEDTWENYHKLKAVLDRRFEEWRKAGG